MKPFENVRFRGKFRDYQQRVILNAKRYLKDGKINIVAAPGSGKTVLGLELIRRLGVPCLILSPTTAIRQQWGERFRDLFLADKADFEALYSNDLHNVRPIISITYQALYTAIEKFSTQEDGDTDCSDIDLFATMKVNGIRTICLDEAHHLKNEWQKALEKFIEALDRNVRIISLTATPPYDSEGAEWERYMKICGEIDEEIFVPELVGQNTLCPHQDYVYFNYPTASETGAFREYQACAVKAVEEIGKLPIFKLICDKFNSRADAVPLFSHAKEYIALFVLLEHYGFDLSVKLVMDLTGTRGLPRFKMHYAQTALQFLLDGKMISEEQKNKIANILKKHGVFDKRKVALVLNQKLKRALISSVGKLESIRQIAKSEIASMGDRLRMLVLTDFIKKENLAKITEEAEFHAVNVVSIFETLRREVGDVKIGVLSGTLVILPNSINLSTIKHRKEPIPGTDYSTVEFVGANHKGIDYVGKLLQQGKIQILVGTKSLLGEGWDSPCINSVVLASFVGSFVLSNQMRGRAIRIDKQDPNKSANIWHLVTVEPEYLFQDNLIDRIDAYVAQDHAVLNSYDFDVLKRRFDSFMGPNYTTGVIESGIERVTAIAPPYDEEGIARINREMLERSARRAETVQKWSDQVGDGKFEVLVESQIPTEKRVPVFTFFNWALVLLLMVLESTCIYGVSFSLAQSNWLMGIALIAVAQLLGFFLYIGVRKLILHCNPARSILTLGRAVYQTLQECELIAPSAKVETSSPNDPSCVSLYLRNASVHDQNIFNTAMTEMLSPIANPRYILISKPKLLGYRYDLSFACPTVIGKKKEHVEVLAEKLKATGNFEPVFTHREDCRKLILKCRKESYISFNERCINRKFRVCRWE